MRILLQRVSSAQVRVGGEVEGSIGRGLLALVGVEHGDDSEIVRRCARRMLELRVFADSRGRMNLDVRQAGGELLVVSQFTLVADLGKGRRPSFARAAPPARARALYEELLEELQRSEVAIERGVFGAMMDVELVNEGPVTFLMEEPRRSDRDGNEAGAGLAG